MDGQRVHRAAYRFGPVERRGIVGGLRPGQLVVLGTVAAGALIVFRSAPNGGGLLAGVLATVVGAAVAFVPVRGRTLEEWAPVTARWLSLRAGGADRYRSALPTAGVVATLDGASAERELDLPDVLAGCEIIEVPVADGHAIGAVRDSSTGTLTGVLAVRVRAFGLLGETEQERRLSRWGQILAGLARNQTPLRRLAILERTVPSDGDELQRYLLDAREHTLPADELAMRSYASLIATAGDVTRDHEVFVALQIDERRAWAHAGRLLRERRPGREELACAVLAPELHAFASRFDPSDVVVHGALSPRMLAGALRLAFDPFRRGASNRLAVACPELAGADPAAFGPVAADVYWDRYRTDGAVHRTYWVAQWPRLAVGPTFLSPLLLDGQAVRSAAIVLEPVAPARARREVEAAITSEEADEQLRTERGFRTTARRRRRHDAALQREHELAEGHQEVRFAAFVTVTARDDDELDLACERVEQAAHQAHLDLQPLWGEQDSGFTQGALPLARGLCDDRPIGGARW